MAVIGVMLMLLIQLSLLATTEGACENCATCDGSTTCLLCNHGYYPSNGICTLCQDNCSNCYNETACAQCLVGFYLDTDTWSCFGCRPLCKSCDSYTMCRICEDKYFLQNGECLTCPIKCLTCLSSTHCWACHQGSWGSTNCSNSCPVECKNNICDISGRCLECSNGKYGKACQYSCPENCLGNTCSLSGSCTEGCISGFYGYICEIHCPFNCKTNNCSENGECTTGCNHGFYGSFCNQTCPSNTCPNNECFQNNGSCVSTCPETCVSCTSLTSCTSCKQGSYGTMCENRCPDSNCKECTQERGTCLKCKDGQFISDTVCIPCAMECGRCEGPTSSNCLSCAKGYYLDINQCKSCNDGCSDCTRHDNCNECQAGYFLATSECIQCPPNCKTCTSTNQCTSCIDGYQGITCDSFVCADQRYSSSSGTDTCECDKQKCSNKNGDTCLSCTYAGWYPSGPGCCPCAAGTYVNNGECVTCPEHCIPQGQCNVSSGACIEGCEDRWWGLKCDQRCNDTCVSCLRDGTCVTCNQNCQTRNGGLVCDDTGRCNGCKPGFFGIHCTNECSNGCGKDDDGYRSCRQDDGGCEFGCEVGFYGPTCTEKDSFSSSALIGGVVGGVGATLLIAAVIVVCFIRRRNLGCFGNKNESTGDQPMDETLGRESGNAVEYVDLQERSGSDGFYNQLTFNDTSRSLYTALGDQSRDDRTYSELRTETRQYRVVTTPAEYENMAGPTEVGSQYENVTEGREHGNGRLNGVQYENLVL